VNYGGARRDQLAQALGLQQVAGPHCDRRPRGYFSRPLMINEDADFSKIAGGKRCQQTAAHETARAGDHQGARARLSDTFVRPNDRCSRCQGRPKQRSLIQEQAEVMFPFLSLYGISEKLRAG